MKVRQNVKTPERQTPDLRIDEMYKCIAICNLITISSCRYAQVHLNWMRQKSSQPHNSCC